MIPAPAAEVVEYLKRAVDEEMRGYNLKGGGRDFRLESIQDHAQEWLAMAGRSS